MVRCKDGSLYTGITTDISRRVAEHNGSPRGASYTRARRPVTLVFTDYTTDRAKASQYEWQIKQLAKEHKERLVIQGTVSLAKVTT